MNQEIVIRAENVSKRYRLSHLAGQGTLRDALHHAARLAWRRVRWNTKLNREDFWALNEINFEVKRGEVVGIIGRNGAGKSTLLKVLSRITEPTTGRITLRGRVASLLEVGTGFHPDLSGRDNIFLNGAILGMKRAEIRRKFDEIVAFAEVERFLDTPVKHYSSGMYVRLAFSVAAHLESEILIVDEVLAVGDAQFQKKCIGKMNDVARHSGRTVLFVSHNMDAVMQLCSSAMFLQGGRLASMGPTDDILRTYLNETRGQQDYAAPAEKTSGILRVGVQTPHTGSADLVFTIGYNSAAPMKSPTLGVVVYSMKDVPLFGTNSLFHPWQVAPAAGTTGTASVTIPNLPLWSGTYKASFWLSDGGKQIDAVTEAVTFEIVSTHLPPNAPPAKDIGAVHLPANWRSLP